MLKLEMKMLLNLPLLPRVLAVLQLMPAMKASNFIMREFTESKTAALNNLIMESLLLDMELMKNLEKPTGLSRIVGEPAGEIKVMSKLPGMKKTCVVLQVLPAILLSKLESMTFDF